MKQFPSVIYKRFLQKSEQTKSFTLRTIAAIPEKIRIDDITLAGNQNWNTECNAETIIILPLAGGLQVRITDQEKEVEIGQMGTFSFPILTSLEINNPFKNEVVNFLVVRFSFQSANTTISSLQMPYFTLNERDYHLTIRQFGNREEYKFLSEKIHPDLMVICLAGAFEFENRLIEDREGLHLTPTEPCEMESLCEGSILLFIQY
ncbi:MAG: hypothetical protein RLZZ500_1374 [Bacteroidota bacterium]